MTGELTDKSDSGFHYIPLEGKGTVGSKMKTDNKEKKKGALFRIKDSIKAVASKIKSGMKSLAHKIKSSFCRKPSVEEAPPKIMIVERASGFVGVQYVPEEKKPGLFSRTQKKISNICDAIVKALLYGTL